MTEDDIKRIVCVHDGCGTFPMDRETYRYYKRTGESFTCPAGHSQHFTESTESKLREQIDELEREIEWLEDDLERYEDWVDRLQNDRDDYKSRLNTLRDEFFPDFDGVRQLDEEWWAWGCPCGGHSRGVFETEQEARNAYRQHRTQSCDLTDEEAGA